MIPQIAKPQNTSPYRFPRRLIAGLAWATILPSRGTAGRQRSFARDARWAVSELRPAPRILGAEHIPPHSPCLVVCNHYSRDGLGVWWGALALTAAIAEHHAPDAGSPGSGAEIRWVMTGAWTFADRPGPVAWKHRLLTPLTRRVFARVASVYGFVPMPPMPPDPDEMAARAAAVRRTVRLAREIASQGGMIGLAPEGRNVPGPFGQLPAGVGTFMAMLVQAGLVVLPAGIGERRTAGGTDQLCVSFGPPFTPTIPTERARRDEMVSLQVVEAIQQCLRVIHA